MKRGKKGKISKKGKKSKKGKAGRADPVSLPAARSLAGPPAAPAALHAPSGLLAVVSSTSRDVRASGKLRK